MSSCVVALRFRSSASYILRDEAEWNIARTLLADIRTTRVVVTNCQGDTVYERDTGLLNRKFFYPLKVVFCDPKRTNWPSRMITLDATGLGGSDLPSLSKADIIVRTDKHKQNIYGPSMSTVETVTKSHAWGRTVSTALGISKAAHEFLVLHYFATGRECCHTGSHAIGSAYYTCGKASRSRRTSAKNPYCTLPPAYTSSHLEGCSFTHYGLAARLWETSVFQYGQSVATGNQCEHQGVFSGQLCRSGLGPCLSGNQEYPYMQ